jgi:ABC-type nickel/cobalt efflux system permease component RcnA
MEQFPVVVLLLYALYEGVLHAFEADHILAVTNIVSQRNKIFPAFKDGIFWGLGHTSTIFLIGILMILFKVNIPEPSFSWFEAAVGLMLILVASYRFYIFLHDEPVFHKHNRTHHRDEQVTPHTRHNEQTTFHAHRHEHAGENEFPHVQVHHSKDNRLHKTSYGIGTVHGLAGSGALVVLVMTQIGTIANSLLYLLLFGIGSIVGMTLVAGVFSIPFSKKRIRSTLLRMILISVSSILCFAYGCYVIYENLFA